MSDSDRPSELRRQRALLQQHLDWLDREIASAESPPPITAVPSASERTPFRLVEPDSSLAPAAPSTSPTEADAEAVMAEYRLAPHDLQREVRNGCLMYTAVAFALLVATIAILYFALRH